MAHLLVPGINGLPHQHLLTEGRMTVGRNLENSIVLDHASISGCHAEIIKSAGNVILRDLKSSNGTKVNGQPVDEATITDGDIISFGPIETTFILHSPSQGTQHELQAPPAPLPVDQHESAVKHEVKNLKSISDSLRHSAAKVMSNIGAAARLTALKARIEKLTHIDLNYAYYGLGKKCYDLGLHRDQFAQQFEAIAALEAQIGEKSKVVPAAEMEATGDKIKRMGTKAMAETEAAALRLKLRQLFVRLGKQVSTIASDSRLLPEIEALQKTTETIRETTAKYEALANDASVGFTKRQSLVLAAIAFPLVYVITMTWSSLVSKNHDAAILIGRPLDGEASPHLVFDDPAEIFELTIERVFIGENVYRKFHAFSNIGEIRAKGNNIVYFEVIIKNNSEQTASVFSQHFQLRTDDQVSWQYKLNFSDVHIDVLPSQKGHYDISFEYPSDKIPSELVFDTSRTFKGSGGPLVAVAHLAEIPLFSRPDSQRPPQAHANNENSEETSKTAEVSVQSSLRRLAASMGVSDGQLEQMIKRYEGRSKYRDAGKPGVYSRAEAEEMVRAELTGFRQAARKP